jgi:hypothetical protein
MIHKFLFTINKKLHFQYFTAPVNHHPRFDSVNSTDSSDTTRHNETFAI